MAQAVRTGIPGIDVGMIADRSGAAVEVSEEQRKAVETYLWALMMGTAQKITGARASEAFKQVTFSRGNNLIFIGCGTGADMFWLADKVDAASIPENIYSIEPDRNALLLLIRFFEEIQRRNMDPNYNLGSSRSDLVRDRYFVQSLDNFESLVSSSLPSWRLQLASFINARFGSVRLQDYLARMATIMNVDEIHVMNTAGRLEIEITYKLVQDPDVERSIRIVEGYYPQDSDDLYGQIDNPNRETLIFLLGIADNWPDAVNEEMLPAIAELAKNIESMTTTVATFQTKAQGFKAKMQAVMASFGQKMGANLLHIQQTMSRVCLDILHEWQDMADAKIVHRTGDSHLLVRRTNPAYAEAIRRENAES